MADIRHRVGIAASQERVYEALTTLEGLAGWWTRHVAGDPSQGGALRFFFGGSEPGAVMEVAEITPTHHVGWRCTQGPDEWVGTTVTFDIKPSDGETVLLFTHGGWREPVEFMHHCSTKWAQYLIGLKSWLEGGVANVYPDGASISAWG
jgi:uncharacterized protein YndB with AHSA1/START domain